MCDESNLLGADDAEEAIYLARIGECDQLLAFLQHHTQVSTAMKDASIQQYIEHIQEPESGNTLLHYASANGHLPVIRSIINLLLQRTSDTREHEADVRTLAYMLRTNKSGNTSLHWASFNGHLQVVAFLVESIDRLSLQNDTANNKNQEKENLAARRRVWDVVNVAGRGPMSEAQMRQQEEVVRYLLDRMIAESDGSESALSEREEEARNL